MRRRGKRVGVVGAIALALLATMAPAQRAQAMFFTGTGDLPGGTLSSLVQGLSPDGSVAVGKSIAAGGDAFLWTAQNGISGFQVNPAGIFDTDFAVAASNGGSVIVGIGRTAAGTEAFRWTASGGLVGLQDGPGDVFTYTKPSGVSADGFTTVGIGGTATGSEAFLHTPAGGIVGLGVLPGYTSSGAMGVSADGSVIVGSNSSSSHGEAFRWTEATGVVGLGGLTGGTGSSNANAVSADGLTVVGAASNAIGRQQAVSWTETGGMVGLGDPTFSMSVATGVSANGSTIVGTMKPSSTQEAFVWTDTSGMRPLQNTLQTDYGLDLTGWQLSVATSISADGNVIAGFGTNPNGNQEGWVADLRPGSRVAEPPQYELQLIAKKGTVLPDGTVLDAFPAGGTSVDINDRGTVAFIGDVLLGAHHCILTQEGLHIARGATLGDGLEFLDLDASGGLSLNDAGAIAFTGMVRLPDGRVVPCVMTRDGVLAGNGGPLLDGTTVEQIATNFGVSLNDSGLAAFVGRLNGDPSGTYSVLTQQGALALVGHTLGDGSVLTNTVTLDGVSLNAAGKAGFSGFVAGVAGLAVLTQDGIVVPSYGFLGDGAWSGAITPGDVCLNDLGTVAFWSDFGSGNYGIAVQDGLVVLVGDMLGDRTIVASIGDFHSGLAMNNDGQVAFVGEALGVKGLAVMTQDGWVAGPGDYVDGLMIKFAYPSEAWGTRDLAMNNNGDIVFVAHLDDGSDAIILARRLQDEANVPEPATMALLGLGALALLRRRRKP